VSNDTTYRRWRAIKIDTASPSTDQRPALAPLTELQSYNTLQVPHVVQNDLPNGFALFGAMARYRLYRRAGLDVRFIDSGKTLAQSNKIMLIARARFGGKVLDASAFCKATDGQA
jgi:HK97 family phage major capsid protein